MNIFDIIFTDFTTEHERTRNQLRTLEENNARLVAANDKLEKQIQGVARADMVVKNRGRRKTDAHHDVDW